MPRGCSAQVLAFAVIVAAGLCTQRATAVVALPPSLTSLLSPEGERLFVRGSYVTDAFVLLEQFVSQVNGAFCGVASSVMVLNALGVSQPLQDPSTWLNSPNYAAYDQTNVFINASDKVKTRDQVLRGGFDLDELSNFLAAHPGVNSTYRYSRNLSLQQFRDLLVSALAQPQMFVIVNFLRAMLKEAGWGHHSPVGAYNAEQDAVLVLDVSRYKYPAWWVPVRDLYESTLPQNTSDTSDVGRGLTFVWAPAGATPRLGAAYITPTLDDGAPLVSNALVTMVDGSPSPGYMAGVVLASLAGGLLLAGLLALIAVQLQLVHLSVGGRASKGEQQAKLEGHKCHDGLATAAPAQGGHATESAPLVANSV